MGDGNTSMPTEFVPDADNARLLRDAFGRFATGVTLITTGTDEGPMGMVANSFSSLSMDPALVMWAPARSSRRFPHFESAQHFAIHILADDQADLCNGFIKNPHAFDGFDMRVDANGVPLVENCLARFECTHFATHDGGDHVIVVGQVTKAEMKNGEPLAFFAGGYRELVAPT